MPRESSPTIQAFNVRAVRVPMTEAHQSSGGVIAESPLVLMDVLTDAGISGHSMVFTYTLAALKPTAELIRNIETLVTGEPLAPAEIEQRLARRFRLLGTQGLIGIALAAIDMALWVRWPAFTVCRLCACWAALRSRSRPTGRSGTTAWKAARKPPNTWRGEDSAV